MAIIAAAPALATRLAERLTAEGRRWIEGRVWPPDHPQGELGLILAHTTTPASLAMSIRRTSAVPLIIVSDAPPADRARAVDLGADICLRADEDPAVVEAHTMALLRRDVSGGPSAETRVRAGRLVLDFGSRRAMAGDLEITLSRREFDLLAHLMRRPGRAFRRHDLLAAVWGPRFVGESNTVDVHIAWLRQKLPVDAGVRLTTLRGIGYRLDLI